MTLSEFQFLQSIINLVALTISSLRHSQSHIDDDKECASLERPGKEGKYFRLFVRHALKFTCCSAY